MGEITMKRFCFNRYEKRNGWGHRSRETFGGN